MYGIDYAKPIESSKRAWRDTLGTARVKYRRHDLRHSFVSRLASNPTISESTFKALSGHLSKRTLEHYSPVHQAAKRTARRVSNAPILRQGSHKVATAQPALLNVDRLAVRVLFDAVPRDGASLALLE